MSDVYQSHFSRLISPADNAAELTLSDSTNLTTFSRVLWVGGAGNLIGAVW
jgi:hypothetical protein